LVIKRIIRAPIMMGGLPRLQNANHAYQMSILTFKQIKCAVLRANARGLSMEANATSPSGCAEKPCCQRGKCTGIIGPCA